MVYDTKEEMEKVTGRLEDNSFIAQQQKENAAFKLRIQRVKTELRLL